jgi:hypothetical protein
MQKAGHRDPSTTKLYDRRGYNPEKAASCFANSHRTYAAKKPRVFRALFLVRH